MNIALLTYALDRSPRGIGHYTRNLINGFSDLGYTPLLLSAGGGVQGKNTLSLFGSAYLPALITLGQLEIGWYTKKYDLEIVHDPIGIAPFAACKTKKVITLCDVFPLSFPGYSAKLENLIYKYWLPKIVPKLDKVITISHHSKKDICEYLTMPESKISVTQLATDARFRPLPDKIVTPVLSQHHLEEPYILYVGSIEPRKNLVRLLKAFAQTNKKLPQFKLVIVGARNYWKSSPVAETVKEFSLQDQVVFTGYIPDEDLPAIYNGAYLFCFPSLYEGFGLPVLEAMACGTPVITSNTSSLPEVAGDAALLVDPYQVEDIATGMENVLENPSLTLELKTKGLERAKQFTWEKTARETIKVYQEILGK
jgi:glycosyltransferase involved in cell wall biosynthesis